MCGGTLTGLDVEFSALGLSPRVRGTSSPRRAERGAVGLSPRVRGTCLKTMPWTQAMGLSPRVRGHPDIRQDDPRFVGSIPAGAGAPRRYHALCHPFRVYPRVCGGTDGEIFSRIPKKGLSPRVRGHRGDVRTSPVQPGLSPRVRGHQYRSDEQLRITGSIPACAGAPLSLYA